MIGEIDADLISPDKLMTSSDMAKLGCRHCEGCSECCKDRAESITLDAWDIRMLKEGLNYSFEGLLSSSLITLRVVDGVILPCLSVKEGEKEECVFLKEDGRCAIHSFRPGICRMFPLARIWQDDGSFSYFLQTGECSQPDGVKIRISKWLDYPNIRAYEESVREFHDALTALRGEMKKDLSHEEQVRLQRQFLEQWFIR
ncbi:MAG: YkgJ family cysteine cluster protein [Lachnospiraceae bacterium]|nr:YkgJ family cysteine cluster protein [Lachnospiraceae bacterium]MBR3402548.1 YkgJ family cysteine cluster protein [Parasporobacterium sp.]